MYYYINIIKTKVKLTFLNNNDASFYIDENSVVCIC